MLKKEKLKGLKALLIYIILGEKVALLIHIIFNFWKLIAAAAAAAPQAQQAQQELLHRKPSKLFS